MKIFKNHWFLKDFNDLRWFINSGKIYSFFNLVRITGTRVFTGLEWSVYRSNITRPVNTPTLPLAFPPSAPPTFTKQECRNGFFFDLHRGSAKSNPTGHGKRTGSQTLRPAVRPRRRVWERVVLANPKISKQFNFNKKLNFHSTSVETSGNSRGTRPTCGALARPTGHSPDLRGTRP